MIINIWFNLGGVRKKMKKCKGKRKKGQMSDLSMWMVGALLALILVVTSVDFIYGRNTVQANTETNLALASNNSNALTSLEFNDLAAGSETVTNSSGSTLAETTNYILDDGAGTINVTNSADDGLLNMSYSYRPDGYLTNNLQRTLILVAALLIVVAGIVFIAAKITMQ